MGSRGRPGPNTATIHNLKNLKNHFWLKIGPIEVPRPPPGSNFGETDTRNPIFGVPGPLGAKLGNFELGGWGAHVCYSLPRLVCANLEFMLEQIWVGVPCML